MPLAIASTPPRPAHGTLNRTPVGGVLPSERDGRMSEFTLPLARTLLSVDADLEREFESHLVESSTLAFRVAYGVLRQREDAEDVAQEAFTKAYQRFRQLRDRDLFRAFLRDLQSVLAEDSRFCMTGWFSKGASASATALADAPLTP